MSLLVYNDNLYILKSYIYQNTCLHCIDIKYGT